MREYYEASVGRGVDKELAKVTLARKIAAVALRLWKKGEVFDVKKLPTTTKWVTRTQAIASRSERYVACIVKVLAEPQAPPMTRRSVMSTSVYDERESQIEPCDTLQVIDGAA